MGDLAPLLEVAGNFGAFALVAWLVRHTFNHTIPRLAEDFKDMLTAQREAAVGTINSERTAFIEEQKAQRKDFLDELRRLTDAARSERGDWLDKMDKLREEVASLRDELRRSDD